MGRHPAEGDHPGRGRPLIAGLVAAAGTWLVYRITRNVVKKRREEGFRWGQIATASLVALSHGTNDAQKTMGVIALALITTGHLTGNVKETGLPFWIIASCALAIGLGTYLGGWRVIRTLGKGLVEIESPQGLAAEASSAAIILSSSAAGMALSTTHVATGSILGTGVGKPGAEVRWAVAGRMVLAWLVTLPAAGIVGALSYWLSHLVGNLTTPMVGDLIIFALLVVLSGYMWWRAQQEKVDSSNVNAEWDDSTNSVVPADVRESRAEAPSRPRTRRPRTRRLLRRTPPTTRLRSSPHQRRKGILDELPGSHRQGARGRAHPRCGSAGRLRGGPSRLLVGAGGTHDDGTVVAPNPAVKFLGLALFTLVGAVVVLALLWITRTTIIHHTGVDFFPFLKK